MTLERVGARSDPRASSPDDPAEWDVTEDGWRFGVGDRVYNYYDGEWVVVLEDPVAAHRGWFDVESEDGGRRYTLNSVRVAAEEPRR